MKKQEMTCGKNEIPFDNSKVFNQLDIKGIVYILNGEKYNSKIVSWATYHGKRVFAINCYFVKTVEVCKLDDDLLTTIPTDALQPYVSQSGFYDVVEWLDSLVHRSNFDLPKYPQTRTFWLYKVTKI